MEIPGRSRFEMEDTICVLSVEGAAVETFRDANLISSENQAVFDTSATRSDWKLP